MLDTLGITLRGSFYLGKYCLRHQENLKPILRSYRSFNSKIRISTSVILKAEKDGKYLLVRNHHRPEQYSPFGGVLKHSNPPPKELARIEWQPDYTTNKPKLKDMEHDLRGMVYGKHFPAFLDWFTRREGREGEQCLYRELREELQEGKVGKILRDKTSVININLVRRVLEGPYTVEDRDYGAQFRYFEIFEPQYTNTATKAVFDELFKRAGNSDNSMKLVTKDEISCLRMKDDGDLIGAHSKYFFTSRWHGEEPPMY